MIKDFPHMELALEKAEEAFANDEVPVGAVIVDSNTDTIIAAESNRMCRNVNPCDHAEMLAIKAACQQRNTRILSDCDLYVTLEPCPMCAAAIALARIRRVYFGAEDEKSGGIMHGPRIFSRASCHHRPDVYGGIRAEKSAQLLKDFFKSKRINNKL